MKQNSLKNLYSLNYDNSNYQSTLVTWYNKMIDKSVDELGVTDVSKMIRQDILRDIAIDRAIELFLIEPFDGEMQDGDLLALLVSCSINIVKSNRVKALNAMILKLEDEFTDFEWTNESSRMLFEKNLSALKQILLQNAV